MIEQKIRPVFQRIFVDGIAKFIAPVIAPNLITLISLIVGLVAAIAFFINQYLCIFLLLRSGYFD
ncbi:CDP-alcohol phosphatidyltransferase, partial [Francisella tularensis subsp. holarctica]